jgi:pimeloyl-ACP methyl ester carboxylesterase
MSLADVGDAVLEYEVLGAGEPVVFIHGALIADSFRPLLTQPVLADRYRLINYHRRGYLGSTHPQGEITIPRHAADCRALMRHLGIERAHVVGHSYGGNVALQLALEAPEVVHSLALLEPGLMVGSSAQGYRDALARVALHYREVGAATAVDEFLRARFGAGYRADLDRLLADAFDQAVADAGTSFEQELLAGQDWSFGEAEARRITQPVLSVLGSESNALWSRFGEAHRLLLEWLPGAEGFVLPCAAHGLQMTNPQGMAEALADFFARHQMRE